MKAAWLPTALIFAGLVGAQQYPNKYSPEFNSIDPNTNVDVIVQFDQVPSATYHQLVSKRQGKWRRTLGLVNGGAYTIPASEIADLASEPGVVYISVDHTIGATLDYTTAATNASAAWTAGWDGTGVGVAVIDSGYAPSSDFSNKSGGPSRIVYSQNFNGSGDATDNYGHGTHVAGIIAGNGSNSICNGCTRTLKGMAPNANLIVFRVLDQNGQSSDSMVIAAINQAITLKSKYNIRVINLSLGRAVTESYKLDPLCQAVESAWKAGIVVVVAAGNDGRNNSVGEHGYGTINAPGNDPYVITVGAMKAMDTYSRTDDLVASYSSKGPSLYDNVVKPDLVAPGNQVISVEAAGTNTLFKNYPNNAVPYSYYSGNNNNALSTSYFRLNGTSMAAAAVSGAVADLLEAHPTLTPDQVKARLMKTAYKTFPESSTATDPVTGGTYTSCYDIFTVGAGYLDIGAALASTYTPSGNALSPTTTFSTGT
jgi:serine protease AprX